MPTAPEPRPSLDPESGEYQRLWDQGLRPRVIWVPDTKDPEFIAEARRQARAIANSPEEEEDLEPTSPPRSGSKPAAAYPPEVVAEWRRAAEEIARSPQEAEDIAWVESVSILFEDDNDAGRDRLS